jgi:hypothetical protein
MAVTRSAAASLLVLVCAAAVLTAREQPAATLPVETLLTDRLGLSAADVERFRKGQAVVVKVPGTTGHEVAAAGAVRAKGSLRRLTAWLRDIEAFRKAAGSVNVGAISDPVVAADFTRLSFNDADFSQLAACRPGRCEFRMTAAHLARLQKEVAWKQPQAREQAIALAKTLLTEYVAAYQKGGDAALGAFHNQKAPNQIALDFQDMLRRSTKAWDLAHAFVSYLETYPTGKTPGVEDRFYWTRDPVGSSPALTLHHVVLQEFPDGRVLLADKQFYASRELDTALMLALGVPNADKTGFDLVVSVKARAASMGGLAARVMRGRIESTVADTLKVYLEWIRASAAL